LVYADTRGDDLLLARSRIAAVFVEVHDLFFGRKYLAISSDSYFGYSAGVVPFGGDVVDNSCLYRAFVIEVACRA